MFFKATSFFLIILLFFICCNKLLAQKIYFGLSCEVHQSFGKDIRIQKKLPELLGNIIYYETRRRYKNPYLNLLFVAYKPLSKKLEAGVEAGCFINYLETYYSNNYVNTVRYNFQIGFNYFILSTSENKLGINAKGGFFLQDINESYFSFHNGLLYNIGLFSETNGGNKVKIGFEKNFNKIAVAGLRNTTGSPFPYHYYLKRLSFYVSYCLFIGSVK
jgi:hypothetical protein